MKHDGTALILATATSPSAAVSSEQTEGGQPVRRFRKELIKAGNYVKPADGLAFSVDRAMLDHWAGVFATMKANGVKVPAPSGHTTDPDRNRGWVEDIFREGDSLFGVISLIGADAIAMAGRSDVSIFTQPQYVDGKGNQYEWPILHVALCTDPVVPGLSGFVPIALSQGQPPVNVPVLSLQEQAAMPDPTPTPAAGAAKPGDAIREAIKQQVIAVMDDDNIDDAQALTKIKDLFKARAKALGILDPIDKAASEGEVSSTPADPMAASHAVAASLSVTKDPMVLRMARKSRKQDLDALVTAGKITPAVRDSLAKQWLPEKDEALALSLSADGCNQFDTLVASLNLNAAVVPMGEQTGPQAVALSHGLNLSEEDAKRRKASGESLRAEARRMAGLPPAK